MQAIVFTNGVFDLLHPGHIQYLDTASKLGTHFIVALNADESVLSHQRTIPSGYETR